MNARLIAATLVVLILLGLYWCTRSERRELIRNITAVPPRPCKVTLPNGSTPPATLNDTVNPTLDRSAFNHGNGDVWTSLPTDGTLRIFPRAARIDDTAHVKFPWWRRVPFTISGRRLDAPAPPLRANMGDGYGLPGFQPSELSFPSEGCWEISAKTDTATLTFVQRVVRTAP